jgi:hypothetical protein
VELTADHAVLPPCHQSVFRALPSDAEAAAVHKVHKQYIFDVMNGPVVEFTERRDFPDIQAARIHAQSLAGRVQAMWRDIEGWSVSLCDETDRVVDILPVPEQRTRSARSQ